MYRKEEYRQLGFSNRELVEKMIIAFNTLDDPTPGGGKAETVDIDLFKVQTA